MRKVLIAKKVVRVTVDFYETLELFSDGSWECAVYYRRDIEVAYFQ